jgi:hypothetical protein
MFYGIGGAKRFQFSPKSPRASDGSIDAEPSLSAYLTMTDCQPYPGLIVGAVCQPYLLHKKN